MKTDEQRADQIAGQALAEQLCDRIRKCLSDRRLALETDSPAMGAGASTEARRLSKALAELIGGLDRCTLF